MVGIVNNGIQIFNETVVLVCLWLMFHFTEYVPCPLIRYELAWYFMYFVAANIGGNVLVLFYIILFKIYEAIRKCYLKRLAKKNADKQVQSQLE